MRIKSRWEVRIYGCLYYNILLYCSECNLPAAAGTTSRAIVESSRYYLETQFGWQTKSFHRPLLPIDFYLIDFHYRPSIREIQKTKVNAELRTVDSPPRTGTEFENHDSPFSAFGSPEAVLFRRPEGRRRNPRCSSSPRVLHSERCCRQPHLTPLRESMHTTNLSSWQIRFCA